ncbi:MAG: CBS domain-containing protein [Bacteroidota bacterium]
MGEARVKILSENQQDMQAFVRHLLEDVQALEYMIENEWFETGVVRIGAEQEMCLVDRYGKPALKSMDILEDFHPDWLTTELAQFNLEFNLSPQLFTQDALSEMEAELRACFASVQQVAERHDTRIALTGILPTIRKYDLVLDNLTPQQRYFALMTALKNMRGADYELRLTGIDELNLKHDSPLLEACNTSFQVHLQVEPNTFVPMYNIAQALAGPTMAIAANSPLLMGKRLWHETRIVLFQQSIDDRKSLNYQRERSPRVTFGTDWLRNSILEIYKEDISRFRPILASEDATSAFDKIREGTTPKLKALQVHNGTVYRWNRPCFGINPDGTPHLRIENRVLPAGPTLHDEMANTAFWLGAMVGMSQVYPDITQRMSFSDARDNFIKGARTGIEGGFNWVDDQKFSAKELVLKELLPLAREGLKHHGVNQVDIDKYLGTIQERAEHHTNGARWMLKTYSGFLKETNKEEALSALTNAIIHNQETQAPVHTWEIPALGDLKVYSPTKIRVEECMTTDFHTVHREDILDLVADIMNWRNIRHLPVEDKDGQLVGLVTSRMLMRHFTRHKNGLSKEAQCVADIMKKNIITICPTETLMKALELMETNNIGCLPVVNEGRLVGLLSESNFLQLTRRLLKSAAKD